MSAISASRRRFSQARQGARCPLRVTSDIAIRSQSWSLNPQDRFCSAPENGSGQGQIQPSGATEFVGAAVVARIQKPTYPYTSYTTEASVKATVAMAGQADVVGTSPCRTPAHRQPQISAQISAHLWKQTVSDNASPCGQGQSRRTATSPWEMFAETCRQINCSAPTVRDHGIEVDDVCQANPVNVYACQIKPDHCLCLPD